MPGQAMIPMPRRSSRVHHRSRARRGAIRFNEHRTIEVVAPSVVGARYLAGVRHNSRDKEQSIRRIPPLCVIGRPIQTSGIEAGARSQEKVLGRPRGFPVRPAEEMSVRAETHDEDVRIHRRVDARGPSTATETSVSCGRGIAAQGCNCPWVAVRSCDGSRTAGLAWMGLSEMGAGRGKVPIAGGAAGRSVEAMKTPGKARGKRRIAVKGQPNPSENTKVQATLLPRIGGHAAGDAGKEWSPGAGSRRAYEKAVEDWWWL